MADRHGRSHPNGMDALFAEEAAPAPPTIMMTEPQPAAGSRLEERPDGETYGSFYRALGVLREEFHRVGRFDDANAKLDELCKLLVLRTLDVRHPAPGIGSRLSPANLKRVAGSVHGSESRIAAALHTVFDEMVSAFPSEFAPFGARRGLNIHADDDEFAAAILPVLATLPDACADAGAEWSFDGVNEAFGHFVQDSFRNRKEDAQYMTPPEVVSAMVRIALADMASDPQILRRSDQILIGDPTCGVGSFLAAAYRHAAGTRIGAKPLADRLRLFGQDKVDRMVRLAAVNLRIFARADAEIRMANSILPPETLDDVAGQFDLIVTNPPFGATFSTTELFARSRADHLPTLFGMARSRSLPKAIDSEYILLDRELALLRPGGRLMMVVPDHVVSGGGFSEEFRLEVAKRFELVAVLDLPTEAFAQAGTRTKTSVVYLRQPVKGSPRRRSHVFMASAENLGFRVISRAGASVKRLTGSNELDAICACYGRFAKAEHESDPEVVCLSTSPSVAAVARTHLLNNRWTAGFYRTSRLAALLRLESAAAGAALVELGRLVDIDPDTSQRVRADATNRCISVLHVREDGSIDLAAVERYDPTTACTRCRPGDVILSKINPRIVRVAVIPETPWELGCSTEFAVLRLRDARLTPWSLALLLRSRAIQDQIQTLTSGTSSSHNRIKDRDLEVVRVLLPEAGTDVAARLDALGTQYQIAIGLQYRAQTGISECFASIDSVMSEPSRP